MQSKLTQRELEVMKLLLDDKTSREIAVDLKISAKTVEFHKKNLYRKLGIRSLRQLYKYLLFISNKNN